MKVTLIENIGTIINVEKNFSRKLRMRGGELGKFCSLDDAYLIVAGDKISSFGKMCDLNNALLRYKGYEIKREDAKGGFLIPSFCDSHTHLVFPHTREKEFGERLAGLTYEQIAANGGGILNSAASMDRISDEEILKASLARLSGVIGTGTGTIEIKSGYGLNVKNELRLLRIIKKLREMTAVTVKSTFLGAHAFPAIYKDNRDYYVDMVIKEMIPQVAEEGLADFADVFCERGFFSVNQAERIFEEALRYGFKPRVHANQLSHGSGAIEMAVRSQCVSADHLEEMTPEEIIELAHSDTIATLLPGCAFFMDSRFPDAKALIKEDATVAIASDYNPGTSPSGNMLFMVALACIKMKMTPQQAVMAATLNGAAALELSDRKGSIAEGKCADFFITEKMNELGYMAYSYTGNVIKRVMLGGEWQV